MILAGLVAPAPITGVEFDAAALRLITASTSRGLLDLSTGPRTRAATLRLRVTPTAPAGPVVMVFGEPDSVLRAHYHPQPYAVSAVLLALRDLTGYRIRCAFSWPDGLPRAIAAILGYSGTAAEVRELLRRAEPDHGRRPVVQLSE